MKPTLLKIPILICLVVHLHHNIFAEDDVTSKTEICNKQFEGLTSEQIHCVKTFYQSIADQLVCVYQPMLFVEATSYCSQTSPNKALQCSSKPQCACSDIHMTCTARGLDEFPQKLDQGITWLHLSRNLLSNFSKMTFNNYPQLLCLDISHNPIRILNSSTFQHLKKLTMLTMSNCELTEIRMGAFHGLNDLKVLDLSFNKLTILTSNMFEQLDQLSMLSLKGNNITTIEYFTFNRQPTLNVLDLSDNSLKSLSSNTFQGLHSLTVLYAQHNQIETFAFNTDGTFPLQMLDMSNNHLHEVTSDTFKMFSELTDLNLNENHIAYITDSAFRATPKLENLNLGDNEISHVTQNLFGHLLHLQTLVLRNNKIKDIESGSFKNLSDLFVLGLSNNQITYLRDDTFIGLNKLSMLTLQDNQIREVGRKVFEDIPNLIILNTDELRFCCLAKHVRICLPSSDEFSSCHDLMTNVVLRISIWTLGVIAVISNIFVIVFRTINQNANPEHSFLIKNLALSDLFMGIYLLTIASVDTYYRGVYGFYESDWRTSTLCNFAGFVSTFSSELTVFTLTVITLDRLLAVAYPFSVYRQEMKRTRLLMLTGWIFALVIALIPLPIFGISYFNNFYGRSGVCLPLHITKDRVNGWQYSVSVFIILNAISFAIITTCYVAIYRITKKTRQNVQANCENRAQQALAFRMTVLVSVDAACWMPIIGLGLRSVAGFTSISPDVYAWIAVFVLPLNAALNPILYTLSLIPLRTTDWKRNSINKYLKFWNKSSWQCNQRESTTRFRDN